MTLRNPRFLGPLCHYTIANVYQMKSEMCRDRAGGGNAEGRGVRMVHTVSVLLNFSHAT